MRTIPESDWKYLRSIERDLIEKLCQRINKGAAQIIADDSMSQHERFLKLYVYIKKEDKVVADCFDDWRRSNAFEKTRFLRKNRLLTPEQIAKLSDEMQQSLSI